VTAVIETQHLSKHFGAVRAVEAIDLRIERGEVYAFLGLNGAGKTTLIRMLLGMIRPSGGAASLFGQVIRAGGRGPWRRVGHLVESPAAYPELSVRENLEITRRLYGVADRGATARALERFSLAAQAHRRAGVLSLGNLQRLGLARALLHNPDLVILDEPANGLDPAGVVEVRELLHSLSREQGTTVFMSSHVLTEVNRLATRIGIVHRGRLIVEHDAATLEHGRPRRLIVDARDRITAAAALAQAGFQVLPATDGGALTIEDARALEQPDEVARLLVAAGAPPTRLFVEQDDLERYFLRLTAEHAAGDVA
jgi:ABC-2 type transport system ATP-binding protein